MGGYDGYEIGSVTQVSYAQYSIDVSAYADGAVHTLDFTGEVFGTGPPISSVTNFFVDDVSLQVCI